jgi:hypothetical protein
MRHNLLTTNTKLEKSLAEHDVIVAGLALAPAKTSGHEVCEARGACVKTCLGWYSGRMVTSGVREAMKRRTRLLFDRPSYFRYLLHEDLLRVTYDSLATSKPAYVRLNVTSDLDWTDIMADFPEVRFYDYSKVRSRCRMAAAGKLPRNYSITPSYNERMPWQSFHAYLRAGLNVSVVFDTEYVPSHGRVGNLPDIFRGWPVIDGDKHDLRHPDFDGRGNVIGLRFKGSRKRIAEAIADGFVVRTS